MIKNLLNKNKPKIFCISFQRTGTTSTGDFFKSLDYNVANYFCSKRNRWSVKWNNGDYESIFKSPDFINNQVFEDDPWWCGDFYRYLFHRFPESKFVLLVRDSDKWFDSMLNHSGGMSLGNSLRHARVYRRESEFYKINSGFNINDYNERSNDCLLPLAGKSEHYKKIYEIRNNEIISYFNKYGKERLFYSTLEDQDKWVKMGVFFDKKISVKSIFHSNKS